MDRRLTEVIISVLGVELTNTTLSCVGAGGPHPSLWVL